MKEKDSRIDSSHQLVLYVEKEDQSYGPVQTGSYMVENYLDDFFDKKQRLKEERLQQLRDAKISPLAYYKDLVDIGEGDLASRVGISKRKLRHHMTPAGFGTITVDILERYSTVFGVPVAQLFQIILCDDETIAVQTQRTKLTSVVVSSIDRKRTEEEEAEDDQL